MGEKRNQHQATGKFQPVLFTKCTLILTSIYDVRLETL